MRAEQFEILQQILSDSNVQVAGVLQTTVSEIKAYTDRVADFVKANRSALDGKTYVLALDMATKGTSDLKVTTLNREVNSGRPWIAVDPELRFVTSKSLSTRIIDCQHRTETAGSFELRQQGTYGYWILKGKLIKEFDFADPQAEPPQFSVSYHPIEEFKKLFEEHAAACVTNEKSVKYWKDRKKRILLSEPEPTETIFHRSLYWWLDRFVLDKLKIYAEARGFGQNKTDINIVTTAGTHVIEVKWLGTNGKTTYSESRITEGLVQVAEYLNNDKDLVYGWVVFYDARENTVHLSRCAYDKNVVHQLCQQPFILFLESETPSEKASTSSRK